MCVGGVMSRLTVTKRDLLEVTERIYDASLNPDGWQDVVDAVQKLVPMAGVGLSGMYAADNPAYFFSHQGYDDGVIDQFLKDYTSINPWRELMPFIGAGNVLISDDCPFTRRVYRTPYYSFLRENHIGAGVGVSLSNEDSRVFYLSVDYDQRISEQINAPIAAVVNELAPHLARSFETCHRTANLRSRGATLAAMIDHLALPAVAVTSNLEIRFCNGEGQDLIADQNGISQDQQGRLTLEDRKAQDALRSSIRAATAIEWAGTSPTCVSFASKGSKALNKITVVPLKADQSIARNSLGGFLSDNERLALLIIANQGNRDKILKDRLRQKFELTEKQADLAIRLLQGKSVTQCAAESGTAKSTIKNHLQALFNKTETNRQPELIALLHKVSADW